MNQYLDGMQMMACGGTSPVTAVDDRRRNFDGITELTEFLTGKHEADEGHELKMHFSYFHVKYWTLLSPACRRILSVVAAVYDRS
jgi:hypothetical protein